LMKREKVLVGNYKKQTLWNDIWGKKKRSDSWWAMNWGNSQVGGGKGRKKEPQIVWKKNKD